MKEQDLEHAAKNPIPSYEAEIDGIGKITVYGELDVEKLIKRLLECKGITG